jgi:hypothetical protein
MGDTLIKPGSIPEIVGDRRGQMQQRLTRITLCGKMRKEDWPLRKAAKTSIHVRGGAFEWDKRTFQTF